MKSRDGNSALIGVVLLTKRQLLRPLDPFIFPFNRFCLRKFKKEHLRKMKMKEKPE
jgi:hypothetical protein